MALALNILLPAHNDMNLDGYISWHPQHAIHRLDDCVLFLGESSQFTISILQFNEIDCCIRLKKSLFEYIFENNDISAQVIRLKQVEDLLGKGILHDLSISLDDYYHTPSFSRTISFSRCLSEKIICLVEGVDHDVLVDIISREYEFSQWHLVLVDDLLDPRLIEINNIYNAENVSWLLIKINGRQPVIGPLFRRDEGPCYLCLREVLIKNNPVREWHRRLTQTDVHGGLPTLSNRDNLSHILKRFKDVVSEIQNNLSEHGLVYELEPEYSDGNFYSVTRLPQCKCCGQPDLIHETFNSPIILNDVIPDEDNDGGFRDVSRDITLNKIYPTLNPLTGYVTSLSEITSGSEDQMAIFEAAYYQNSFSATKPDVDTFIQLSLGKGISKSQAKCSALAEALERLSAQYTGDEPVLVKSFDEINGCAYKPHLLSPFSDSQYRLFSELCKPTQMEPQVVKKYSDQIPIHWSPGWSLTKNSTVYFPTAFCFANTPYEDQEFSVYTHNGNAAGNTLEEAILQGALETIERDAAAIWWYNQIPRSAIDMSVISPDNRAIIESSLLNEWRYWLLDISNEFTVVSCVAVAQHTKTKKFAVGFGSHFSVTIAAQRALSELYQLVCIKSKVSGPFDFDSIKPHPFLFPRKNSQLKTLDDYPVADSNNIKHFILHLIESLKEKGLEMCVVNYSRPDIPLNTVKVVIPGLCHFWPQLANKRLYEVPVEQGWLRAPLEEGELNSQALYL